MKPKLTINQLKDYLKNQEEKDLRINFNDGSMLYFYDMKHRYHYTIEYWSTDGEFTLINSIDYLFKPQYYQMIHEVLSGETEDMIDIYGKNVLNGNTYETIKSIRYY